MLRCSLGGGGSVLRRSLPNAGMNQSSCKLHGCPLHLDRFGVPWDRSSTSSGSDPYGRTYAGIALRRTVLHGL